MSLPPHIELPPDHLTTQYHDPHIHFAAARGPLYTQTSDDYPLVSLDERVMQQDSFQLNDMANAAIEQILNGPLHASKSRHQEDQVKIYRQDPFVTSITTQHHMSTGCKSATPPRIYTSPCTDMDPRIFSTHTSQTQHRFQRADVPSGQAIHAATRDPTASGPAIVLSSVNVTGSSSVDGNRSRDTVLFAGTSNDIATNINPSSSHSNRISSQNISSDNHQRSAHSAFSQSAESHGSSQSQSTSNSNYEASRVTAENHFTGPDIPYPPHLYRLKNMFQQLLLSLPAKYRDPCQPESAILESNMSRSLREYFNAFNFQQSHAGMSIADSPSWPISMRCPGNHAVQSPIVEKSGADITTINTSPQATFMTPSSSQQTTTVMTSIADSQISDQNSLSELPQTQKRKSPKKTSRRHLNKDNGERKDVGRRRNNHAICSHHYGSKSKVKTP